MFLESVLAVGFVTSCTCGLFQEICGELFGVREQGGGKFTERKREGGKQHSQSAKS